MLEMRHVTKIFNPGTVDEKIALNDLSFTLNDGDFVTVIGGNGAGKSTMQNAICGTWLPDAGEILLDGIDLSSLSEHQRAKYLGRVYQDPMTGTAAGMQIEENLALAARRGLRRTLRPGIRKAEREEYRQRLQELGLGLDTRLSAKVGTLSGGQRQALTLLMATLRKPKLLLLDEHTAALDPKTAAKVTICGTPSATETALSCSTPGASFWISPVRRRRISPCRSCWRCSPVPAATSSPATGPFWRKAAFLTLYFFRHRRETSFLYYPARPRRFRRGLAG